MMAEIPPVLIQDDGSARIITINRAHRRNAVDRACAEALYDAFLAFDEDPNVDAAVLCGASNSDGQGAFCAGFDLKFLSETGSADTSFEVKAPSDSADSFENTRGPMGPTRMVLSKPVIAAVEGHAVAGGMELALWCDMRVVAKTAIFGIYCRRFGVPLVDGGTLRLPRLIGQSRAMDLILTDRPVEADEALSMGLANRVVDEGTAVAAAVSLARELSKFPQQCMRNDRLSVIQQWGMSHETALRNEMRLGAHTVKSGETVSGADRFSGGEGRHGKFKVD